MIGEYTQESLKDVVERSITADDLCSALTCVFSSGVCRSPCGWTMGRK